MVKTQYKGDNAFIGNEVVMDTLFSRDNAFKKLKVSFSSLEVTHNLNLIKLDIALLKVESLESKNLNLSTTNTIIGERLDNQNKKHETEILYFKEKAKGKFTAFLLGTGLGALIVSILTII